MAGRKKFTIMLGQLQTLQARVRQPPPTPLHSFLYAGPYAYYCDTTITLYHIYLLRHVHTFAYFAIAASNLYAKVSSLMLDVEVGGNLFKTLATWLHTDMI